MNKQEFLSQLRKGLSGLPKDDIAGRLTFYSEMIEGLFLLFHFSVIQLPCYIDSDFGGAHAAGCVC